MSRNASLSRALSKNSTKKPKTLAKLHSPHQYSKVIFTQDVAGYKWGIPQQIRCLTIAKSQQRDKASLHKTLDFTASVFSPLLETYLSFLPKEQPHLHPPLFHTFLHHLSWWAGRNASFFWIKNPAITLTAALCCCFPILSESHLWKELFIIHS